MAIDRTDAFHTALALLRTRLRSGGFAPGARIAATEVAEAANLSPTPVREALSRLVGEGLLEDRRGQGVFVPSLTGADIADLFQLAHAHLAIAHHAGRAAAVVGSRTRTFPGHEAGADPVAAVEALFLGWIAARGSRVLMASYRGLADRLAPVRRLEPLLIEDLAPEAEALTSVAPDDAAAAALARRFHRRRARLAEAFARLLAAPLQEREL
jgi:DNA-binding GntR family transcriptional regulator